MSTENRSPAFATPPNRTVTMPEYRDMPKDDLVSILEDQRDADVIKVQVLIRPASGDHKGYIGAKSSYPPRKGENWRRGNDLADGPANEETLARIVDDVRAVMHGYRNAYEAGMTEASNDG